MLIVSSSTVPQLSQDLFEERKEGREYVWMNEKKRREEKRREEKRREEKRREEKRREERGGCSSTRGMR